MGRKQREKKARQQQQQATPRAAAKVRPKRRAWLPWAIAVAAIIVVAASVSIYYVYANRIKLMQIMIYTQAVQMHNDLERRQAAFTLPEGRRLADVLAGVQRLSGDKAMDLQVAGHLNFVLQVEKEIIKSSNLEPGELDKLEDLVSQAAQILGRKHQREHGAGRP